MKNWISDIFSIVLLIFVTILMTISAINFINIVTMKETVTILAAESATIRAINEAEIERELDPSGLRSVLIEEGINDKERTDD